MPPAMIYLWEGRDIDELNEPELRVALRQAIQEIEEERAAAVSNAALQRMLANRPKTT